MDQGDRHVSGRVSIGVEIAHHANHFNAILLPTGVVDQHFAHGFFGRTQTQEGQSFFREDHRFRLVGCDFLVEESPCNEFDSVLLEGGIVHAESSNQLDFFLLGRAHVHHGTISGCRGMGDRGDVSNSG